MAQWKLFGKTLAISAVAVLGTTAVLALAGYFSLARGVGIAVGYLVSVLALWLLFKAWDLSLIHICQQILDFVTKCLCNEGDVVAVENPAFLGAFLSFRCYGAKLVGVSMEEDGVRCV